MSNAARPANMTPKRNGMRQTPIKRTAFGAQQKARVMWEAQQAKTLEGAADRLGLFSLHHVDWLHIAMPIRDKGTLKTGAPDYFILGNGWGAWLEIKARSLETGKLGSLRANQINFHARLRQAGYEVWTAYLPDDLQAVNLWLRERTGVVCQIDGLMEAT